MGNMKIKYQGATVESPGKDSGYYPQLTIPGKAVPELNDKKIGSVCKIIITGKMKSMRDDSQTGTTFDLEVHDAKYYAEE